jgi:hypothetical protein
LGLLVGLVGAPALPGQTVTLPSIRATGPSPEVRVLRRYIAVARTMYDTASGDTATKRKATALNQALDRLALAPVSKAQARRLLAATSVEDTTRILHGVLPEAPDRAVLGALRALRAGRDTSAKSADFEEVSEYETGSLLESLREEEADRERAGILDTLSMVARAAVVERKLRARVFAPVGSREQAMAFWRQPGFSTLNVGAVSGTSRSGAAFTELASPFLHAVRVSVNAVLSAEKEEGAAEGPADGQAGAAQAEEPTSESTINRFVNGGGLLNVAFAWPAAHFNVPNGAFSAMVLAVPRFGATVPALGANQRDSTLLYDLGTEVHLKSVDMVDGVGVFFQTRLARAGGSGKFGELLGVERGRNHFEYATLSTGLFFGNRYLITASRTLLGPETLRELGWQVGVTAMRAPASR